MINLIDGELKNNSHIYYLRVHYEDTDVGGMVYHAQYLAFMERARSSLIRLLKKPSENLLKSDFNLVVRNAKIEWQDSSKLGDLIFVKTTLFNLSGASLTLKQEVCNFHNNKIFVSGLIKICVLNVKNKATRIPKDLKSAIKSWTCPTIDPIKD